MSASRKLDHSGLSGFVFLAICLGLIRVLIVTSLAGANPEPLRSQFAVSLAHLLYSVTVAPLGVTMSSSGLRST